jgi:hypothetical protein
VLPAALRSLYHAFLLLEPNVESTHHSLELARGIARRSEPLNAAADSLNGHPHKPAIG